MNRRTIQALLGLHPACLTDPQTRTLFVTWLKEAVAVLNATMIRGEMIIADRSPEEQRAYLDTVVSAVLWDLTETAATHVGLYNDDEKTDAESSPIS